MAIMIVGDIGDSNDMACMAILIGHGKGIDRWIYA